jgi:UDP-3-O-[3-hydroxymyristoyl] glucosamine N-acyltransferase
MKEYIIKVMKNPIIIGDIYFENIGLVDTAKNNSITFCEKINFLHKALENNNISVIITTENLYKTIKKDYNKSYILVENPKFYFWKLYNFLVEKDFFKTFKVKHFRGKNIDIHPTAYVEYNTYIGDNVKIGAYSIILEGTIIESNSVIHNHCTIGAEGLQSTFNEKEKIFIKHIGGVKIGKNVNILSNSVVSRGVFPFEFTEIGDYTFISLLCSIGHNVKIGKYCNIAGNSLIGGSAIIEDNVWIGPSSTIKDGIIIGKNASIKIGSVVVKDIKHNEEVSGNFAYNHAKRIRNYVKEQRL